LAFDTLPRAIVGGGVHTLFFTLCCLFERALHTHSLYNNSPPKLWGSFFEVVCVWWIYWSACMLHFHFSFGWVMESRSCRVCWVFPAFCLFLIFHVLMFDFPRKTLCYLRYRHKPIPHPPMDFSDLENRDSSFFLPSLPNAIHAHTFLSFDVGTPSARIAATPLTLQFSRQRP